MTPGEGSISGISRAVASGDRSAAEVVGKALDRIDAHNGELGAFTQVFHDEAMERARAIDAQRAAGEAMGSLAGAPIAIKENICTTLGRTTCGSRMLEGYESPFDATVVDLLTDAGAVVVGKTSCDEFAMGSSGENSAFGPTKNPWDAGHVPGGSSAGSAAAVAARLVPAALGSDTGGSIRQPAAYCGVVGLKPTYGSVSRYGLVAFASSLDQIGPITARVEDAARLLGVIARHDGRDATSVEHPDAGFVAGLGGSIEGMRIGIPPQAKSEHNDASVNEAVDRTILGLAELGAEPVEIELRRLAYAVAAYYIIAPAEASSNLARYDGIRYGRRAELAAGEGLETVYARSRAEGFGAEVQRRILLGTFTLSSGYYDDYYGAALRARRLIKGDFDRAFASSDGGAGCDAILLPTAPTPAFRLGECVDDPLKMYLQDIFTAPVNLAGIPAISLPVGMGERDGVRLPVGMQLIGPAFGESRLVRIAHALEGSLAPIGAPPVG